jgi:tetratricopeptide (TPR) repeat protein
MTWTRLATLARVPLALALAACSTAEPSMDDGARLFRGGEFVSAADAFSRAIAANPRASDAWNNRGVVRVRTGDLTGAIADFTKAVELAPYDAELYYNRANALVAARGLADAIADYTRAVEISPTYPKAIFNRGTAYAMLGQRDAARADWARAIAQETDEDAKAAMRRSAGADAAPAVAATPPPAPPAPRPAAAPPAVAAPSAPPAAPPRVAVAPPQPAASPKALDARALASRAITRELEGDHAGAVQDLNSALLIESDLARRASLSSLIKLLDTPR